MDIQIVGEQLDGSAPQNIAINSKNIGFDSPFNLMGSKIRVIYTNTLELCIYIYISYVIIVQLILSY